MCLVHRVILFSCALNLVVTLKVVYSESDIHCYSTLLLVAMDMCDLFKNCIPPFQSQFIILLLLLHQHVAAWQG